MNDPLQRLDKALHGGGLATILATLGLAWWFVYRPLETARAEASARCQEIATLLGSADRLRAEQAVLERSGREAQRQEESLRARVPNEAHEAEFLRQISRLAKEVGVVLRDYRPGQARNEAKYSAMEVALTCAGPYEGLCRFLDGIGRLPRLVDVSRLEIDGSQSDSGYAASLKLVIYFGADAKRAAGERSVPHG